MKSQKKHVSICSWFVWLHCRLYTALTCKAFRRSVHSFQLSNVQPILSNLLNMHALCGCHYRYHMHTYPSLPHAAHACRGAM